MEKTRVTAVTVLLILMVPMSVTIVNAHHTRDPDVPAMIEVPAGNKVHFHVFAEGVQIYTWTGGSWTFKAPEADLFANAGRDGVVGTHYAGPTWESNSGSKVVGQRVAGATVDPTAIPWLLLKSKSTQGPGIFAEITYIQRISTTGGIAPATPGASEGQVARVHYTAEYFFYRAQN